MRELENNLVQDRGLLSVEMDFRKKKKNKLDSIGLIEFEVSLEGLDNNKLQSDRQDRKVLAQLGHFTCRD